MGESHGSGGSGIPGLEKRETWGTRHIANQEEHHKKVTFQQEYVAFLKKNKIAYDERYIWE